MAPLPFLCLLWSLHDHLWLERSLLKEANVAGAKWFPQTLPIDSCMIFILHFLWGSRQTVKFLEIVYMLQKKQKLTHLESRSFLVTTDSRDSMMFSGLAFCPFWSLFLFLVPFIETGVHHMRFRMVHFCCPLVGVTHCTREIRNNV